MPKGRKKREAKTIYYCSDLDQIKNIILIIFLLNENNNARITRLTLKTQ